MRTPREIELKLECEPLDLAALAGHPLLQAEAGAGTALLEATYFDTPDLALHAAKLSLRVRRENGSDIQTLKAASAAAGLFDRPEWEWTLTGSDPDRDLLRDTPAAAILAEASPASLRPVFRTMVERSTRPIRYGGSDISVTLDAGRVETDQGDIPLCEIELELRNGTPADLFALAQALGESVPLRLGALSKGERGYALIAQTLREPSKAEKIVHEDGATTGAAFARIAQGCLRHLRLNEAVFLHGRDAEALHQMRVALRRLRSAFTLFKPMLSGDASAGVLRDEIKAASEPFGRARNLDVFLDEILASRIERHPDEPGLHDLRERLAADRDQAHQAVIDVIEGRPWRSLMIDLATWIEAGPWRTGDAVPHRDEPAAVFAAEVLQRSRKRIAKRGRHLDRLSPEKRHRVRIEAKRLRYGAEFFGNLFPDKKARKRHKAFVAALSDLQDHLGALNDRVTAHAITAGLTGTPGEPATAAALFAAGLTAGEGDAEAGPLLAAAADAHDTLCDARPFWR